MESVGPAMALLCMFTIPKELGIKELPWGNWTLIGLYTIHYTYRALIGPLLLNPSMSPIHPMVFFSATIFNIVNGLSIGGWCAGYGPTTVHEWSGRVYQIEIGLVVWGWALLGNMFHDDDLREIRRAALRRQKAEAEKDGKPIEGVQKFYMMPKNGLFHYVLYAHYFCEWIEWFGFYMVAGWDCTPARTFLINEISTMLPRAIAGRRWYISKFGKERVGKRKAVIPFLL